jgi:hypothetical protein
MSHTRPDLVFLPAGEVKQSRLQLKSGGRQWHLDRMGNRVMVRGIGVCMSSEGTVSLGLTVLNTEPWGGWEGNTLTEMRTPRQCEPKSHTWPNPLGPQLTSGHPKANKVPPLT